MSFPSQADYEQLVYTLPQSHPEVVSSSLHLYSTLISTLPHHYHVPPDIKHNRLPAERISFTEPNLPTLIAEIARLSPSSIAEG